MWPKEQMIEWVFVMVPLAGEGQVNRPRSRRLAYRYSPATASATRRSQI